MLRAVLLTSSALLAVAPSAAHAGVTGFFTPSKKIGCAYVTGSGFKAYLRCDVMDATNPAPKRPASCEFDYGFSFSINQTGAARRLCVSDTPLDPAFRVLKYGSTWRKGQITCRSRESGLRCTNGSGHGFELARQRQRVF